MKCAALFDWDGVVIESSKQHERSWDLLAVEEGKSLPEGHFLKGFGKRNEYIIPELLEWASAAEEVARLSFRKEELYRELICKDGIEVLPGVKPLLKSLEAAQIPCIVGSSTPRINIETIIGKLGLQDCFQDIVASEDVTRGKPDPEVFLKCADKLGIDPRYCVVIEDAPYGIQAAKAAGMKAVGVCTSWKAEDLCEADLVLESLRELSADRLCSLLA